jgi:hypothetical protein
MAEEKKADSVGSSDKKFSAPGISLPKGGGAISGIGEKFAANPVTDGEMIGKIGVLLRQSTDSP